ncbi:SDR family oxidoreductase [Actinospongicola halichondriae]|uniref:SDR family oxidoreductase n=1 Tax=Actinospongicola halichondriae TaxID=3236844 RepID=UPI003D3CAFE1
MVANVDGPVLLTGAAGLLGTWIRRTSPQDTALVSMVHRRPLEGATVRVDLRDEQSVRAAVDAVRPALVIHAAFARDERSVVDATRNLMRACAATAAAVVHISSDAVFAGDGRERVETDRPDPVWDYGRWKLAAEDLVVTSAPDAAIVRLPLLTSLDPVDHMVRDIQDAGERGVPSTWFVDEMRQPARAVDIAEAIWRIASLPTEERTGPWHLPGPELLSRLTIAERAVSEAGLDRSSIVAGTSAPGATRPLDIRLGGARARAQIGWAPRPIY